MATQAEQDYFENVTGLIDALHEATHDVPPITNDDTQELIAVIQGMADAMQWLKNSTSVYGRQLYSHDKIGLANELNDKVLWRLGHAAANHPAASPPVDASNGE